LFRKGRRPGTRKTPKGAQSHERVKDRRDFVRTGATAKTSRATVKAKRLKREDQTDKVQTVAFIEL
jgi:hypothetical protein